MNDDFNEILDDEALDRMISFDALRDLEYESGLFDEIVGCPHYVIDWDDGSVTDGTCLDCFKRVYFTED